MALSSGRRASLALAWLAHVQRAGTTETTLRVREPDYLHFHPDLHEAFGTEELARHGAACNGTYHPVATASYCAGVYGTERVNLNPAGRPMTADECKHAAHMEHSCGDHYYTNIHTTPTAAVSLSNHYVCGCAHLHAQCHVEPSAIGSDVFKCGRGVRTDCVTGYLPRRTGSSPRGTPCMFPFRWRGVEYTECTTNDGYASCVDLEHWVAVLPFSVAGMDCATYADAHCSGGDGVIDQGVGGGELDPWVVRSAVDKWNRTAAEACCGCSGGAHVGEPLPWCLTNVCGEWGDCACPLVPRPPPVAHCAPLVFDPDTMGYLDKWQRLLNRYDLSDCQSTTVGEHQVGTVAAGASCNVRCASFPWPFDGSPSSFVCPADNQDPTAPPVGVLPDCVIGIPDRNPFLSPPQGVSPDCADAFNVMLDCVRPARRAACSGEGSLTCKAPSSACGDDCQAKVDEMYGSCDEEDGWELWKVGLRAEVEAGGCSSCGRPVLRLCVALGLAVLWHASVG